MHRERKRRQIMLFALSLVLFFMATGYAAFQSKLDIRGSTKVTSNWDVRIINVTSGTPTGNAENSKDSNDNTILPTWDNLSASMSADLYEAGDSMEYIVTISNEGTLDAELDEVTKVDSSSSAVLISYSGYAEGQKIYKKGSSNSVVDIKVTISYNPEYNGDEVTGTSNISFSFKEAESKEITNDTVITNDTYTLTYDCEENGGTGSQTTLFETGKNADLNVKCSKDGYAHIGWNTDKNASSGLGTYVMPSEDSLLYAIYEVDSVSVTYSTVTTSTAITVIASGTATSGVRSYMYLVDGDRVKCKSGTADNVCIIDHLAHGTTYSLEVTAVGHSGVYSSASGSVTTKVLNVPTYIQNKNVTEITYPEFTLADSTVVSCSNGLTCEYSLDGGSTYTRTTTTKTNVALQTATNIIARVSDGDNMVSSSYTFAPTATDLYYDDSDTNLGCDTAQCAIDKVKEEFD